MAGTQKYSAERVATALEESKGMVSVAAKKLGCHPDTVRNYARRYQSVSKALEEAREGMLDAAELALYGAVVRGEAWAVCFYLKTQAKDRGYVEKQQVEVLLQQELEAALEALEDGLEPDEFRKVAGIMVRLGEAR